MLRKNLAMSVMMMFALTVSVSLKAHADSKAEIDTSVQEAMTRFIAANPQHSELLSKAAGVLVFPRVTKAGVGVGGEHGEGALQRHGKTVGYYSVTSASLGLTLGVAQRSEVILFMTHDSLSKFEASKGYKVGVDADVAVMSKGASEAYDSDTLKKPILGFVFGEKGLIGDASVSGSKITHIDRT